MSIAALGFEMSPALPAPITLGGSILLYRLFDVADEICLSRVEELLSAGEAQARSRVRLSRSPRQTLEMRNPPVRLSLGEQNFQGSRLELQATVWDYGVISVLLQFPLSGTWEEWLKRAEPFESNESVRAELDALARRKCQELTSVLADSMKGREERALYEDYVIYFVERLEGVASPRELLERVNVPALILGEFGGELGGEFGERQARLAPISRSAVLENVLQYAEDDLSVIDWNSALVIEPSGQREIPDILEFGVTHLLEFRYFDEMLERRLSEIYDAMERLGQGRWARFRVRFWPGKYAHLSREANARYVEFSELIARIENSLKMVGDFYLAVIFRAALRRFRIHEWQLSVSRKMETLARVTGLLQGEINVSRGHAFEIIIILLIAFEILSAIVRSAIVSPI